MPIMAQLLLPKLTDIRGRFEVSPDPNDEVEVPQGSGRWYWVYFVDDYGKGFPNEHRFAYIEQINSGWPIPTP